MSQTNPFLKTATIMPVAMDSGRNATSRHADDDHHELRRDDFFCAEDYARYLRQAGLEPTDRYGRPTFEPVLGSGSEVSLHRAIHGHDREMYLRVQLGNEELVHQVLRNRACALAAKRGAAPYLNLRDGRAVYDATSFLSQEHGLFFNAFITLAYRQLGVNDPAAMTKLLTDFLGEADGQIKRWGHAFHWLYIHEHSEERGLHTHVLAHVPPAARKPFAEWARDGANSFFWRHCRQTSTEAVDIVIKMPTHTRSAAGWQWDRVQYVTKGLNPNLVGRDMRDGRLQPLFELLGQKENYRRPAGVIPFRQRVGGSKLIWTGAQVKAAKEGMPALSAFGDRAWSYLRLDAAELGWEEKEREARQAERVRREAAKLINAGDDDVRPALKAAGLVHGPGFASDSETEELELELDVYRHVRAARQKALTKRHPYLWDREWIGWWRTLPGLKRWGSANVKRGLAALAGVE